MASLNIKKLKSGTDVRGVASPILGRAVTLTVVAVETIARAFVAWLEKKTGKQTPPRGIPRGGRRPDKRQTLEYAIRKKAAMITITHPTTRR